MCLLNVPSTSFPPVTSSPTASLTPPTASQTPLTGIRLNPCATPFRSGRSGHLASPISYTGYEPNFCTDVSSEHTPINLPTMSFQQEYDATITASEGLNLPRHSGSSTSSQHTAASRVPTLLSKVHWGLASRKCRRITILLTSIKETCADMDSETVVSSLFG